ncbi:MAG: YSIRK-type signal peptide-containing protein, partial [Lactobacillus sp.]|nr:YSIRK-type signal peptide-containing protein [Lactobacillus sp.]
MSSKRNRNFEKNLADEKQRFGIRKFSVGVASVLLGTSLMFGTGSQVAHADSNVDGNGDTDSTDTSASDVHEQNKQVTTNDYTTQSKVKDQEKGNAEDTKATPETKANEVETSKAEDQSAQEAKVDQSKNSSEDKSTSTQESNNKKTESLEKKADDSSLTTQESNQVQKDQSNNVTATTNKSAQVSKETTTLNLQSAQPVVASALKESKAAEPTKQVTATLNIYDYKANDPKTPNVNKGNGVAFTYTGKFTDGLSIKDAIQAQIDADTQKQLAYKDQGIAIVPDKDGLPTAIGVSPVIYGDFRDDDIGGYAFRDGLERPDGSYYFNDTYTKDKSAKLVDDYNKWFDYKKANFALAGYKLADQDEQAINLDDPIEDGKTYNIYVNHQRSVVNVYHWNELKRTVEFKYYYNQNDKNATAADSITKNGYYNDGKYNSTQTSLTHLIDNSLVPQFSNLPSTVPS